MMTTSPATESFQVLLYRSAWGMHAFIGFVCSLFPAFTQPNLHQTPPRQPSLATLDTVHRPCHMVPLCVLALGQHCTNALLVVKRCNLCPRPCWRGNPGLCRRRSSCTTNWTTTTRTTGDTSSLGAPCSSWARWVVVSAGALGRRATAPCQNVLPWLKTRRHAYACCSVRGFCEPNLSASLRSLGRRTNTQQAWLLKGFKLVCAVCWRFEGVPVQAVDPPLLRPQLCVPWERGVRQNIQG